MRTDIDTIIVPDIHGRIFWKGAMPYIYEGYNVIFLGDYLDPYDFEDSSIRGDIDDCIDNFRSILNMAREYNNVTLLLGNHDCSYMFSRQVCSSRTILSHYDEIRMLFRSNKDLFKLATTIDVDDRHIILSHAGISKDWLAFAIRAMENRGLNESDISGDNWEKHVTDMINKWYIDRSPKDPQLINILEQIGESRGGRSLFPSIVWSDIDYDWSCNNVLPTTQIVGHTLQVFVSYKNTGRFSHDITDYDITNKPPKELIFENGKVICVDCRDLFCIKDGNVQYVKL